MRVPTYARGLFLALVAWALGVGLALAHSGLQRAEPPVESTLKRPPKELKLYFSERLEPAYSRARVEDGQGARLAVREKRGSTEWSYLLRAILSARGRFAAVAAATC